MPTHLHFEHRVGAIYGLRRNGTQSIASGANRTVILNASDARFDRDSSDVGLTLDAATGVLTNETGETISLAISYSMTFSFGGSGLVSAFFVKNNDDEHRLAYDNGVRSGSSITLGGADFVSLADDDTLRLKMWSSSTLTIGGAQPGLASGESVNARIMAVK